MNPCSDCQHCDMPIGRCSTSANCMRPSQLTGLPIGDKCDNERKPLRFFFRKVTCGPSGSFFEKRKILHYRELKRLGKFLFHNMDAFSYDTDIGFANASGDFVIDDDKWKLCQPEVKEFETLLASAGKATDIFQVNLQNFSIKHYILKDFQDDDTNKG